MIVFHSSFFRLSPRYEYQVALERIQVQGYYIFTWQYSTTVVNDVVRSTSALGPLLPGR
jgi:hypothetical protein